MKKNEEMVSLNKSFEAEFEVQELEQRLETDPLMFIDILTQGFDLDPCSSGYLNCPQNYTSCQDGFVGCESGYFGI